ncbi:MAG: hypothetical protein JO117_07515, partial [Verrucomicrobia bacterium]|nr:hypothetical protein [Verrucomicrobiota bacterium]
KRDVRELVRIAQEWLMGLSDKGASTLASLAFFCFLAGRIIGAGLLKTFSTHKALATFAVASGICRLLIFLKLGWASVGALFLTYFFMSIMFPTIFSLGIHGLGARAKKATSFTGWCGGCARERSQNNSRPSREPG